MKKSIPVALMVAFVVFFCEATFSQEATTRPSRREMSPRMEEAMKLSRRLRELNRELREAAAEARQNERIQEANAKIRTLQENLRDLRQNVQTAVDKAIVNANPDLAGAVKERREIEERLRELRGGASRRGMGAADGVSARPRRPILQAEETPVQEAEEAPPQQAEEAPLGTIVHFDIPVDNIERARKFYGELFEWKIEKVPGGMEYWMITPIDEKAVGGGMMPRQQPEQTIADYFAVASIDESTAKVTKLGGKVVVPKMAIPGMGYFAYCLDTERNVFALWETNPEAE